jgi:DNA processing protein
MGRILSGAGVTVVSGMALGIDGEAHRGALQSGGNTVAVLGSGLRVPYPASHRTLFQEIGERGLLVSEFLPQESAQPHHFPKRNRIIAALSRAVVVVEAGRKSGALITVDHGLDLGKDIIAIPGSVENPQAVGSNGLLKEGARILTDPSGILELLVELGFPVAEAGPGAGSGSRPDLAIPSALSALWEVLSFEPLGVDDLARRAAASAQEVLAGLSALELGGWVRQCPGMRFQRAPGMEVL